MKVKSTDEKTKSTDKVSRSKKNAPPTNTLLSFLKKPDKVIECVDDDVNDYSKSSSPIHPFNENINNVIDLDDTPAKPVHPFFKAKSTKSPPESSPTDTTQVPQEPGTSLFNLSTTLL